MSKQSKFIILSMAIILIIVLLDVFGFSTISYNLELMFVPVLALFYFFKKGAKSITLILFFLCYTVGELVSMFLYNPDENIYYYLCNISYIIAYFFLILYVVNGLNFKVIFKKYLFYFIVLLLLSIYILYFFINLVKPINFESQLDVAVHIVEFVYNLSLVVLLSLSFLNYIHNNIRKYLVLFLSCFLIAFSEFILITYYFIDEDIVLDYMSTVFFFFGVSLLYSHILIAPEEETNSLLV
ncbi:hypothetical protein CLV86_1411 [Lacinutrix venerupis]|nr:hypothetical protein CLV86_1411 [Lacinutrix venerupis]